METILILDILGFAALGHLITEFLYSNQMLQFKPFNCNMCLTFWISLLPFMVEDGLYGLPMAAIAGVVSETIYKLLQRL